MFLRTKLAMVGLAMGLAMPAVALAQQSPSNNNSAASSQPNQQMRRMRMRPGMGLLRGLRELDLTDQQRQQLRTIVQSQFQTTKPQRLELRQLAQKRRTGTLTADEIARAKELRQQIRQSEQGVHAQLLALLTADQKAKLEELRKTRMENRGKLGPRNRLTT